jgi:hypothetical protein
MARGGKAKQRDARRQLPPPLPPDRRTVGQLVGESIRLYQRRFWRSLALGVLPGVAGVVGAELVRWEALVFAVVIGAPLFTLSYMFACAMVHGVPARGPAATRAFLAGVLAFIPFPVLASLFVLPGVAWLALLGLVVPVALIEGLGVRESFARAYALARADYVHVLGGLCTLAIVVVLSQGVIYFLLRSFADTAARTSAGLAGVVLSPLLFIGAAILYDDQAARIRSGGRRPRRSDADLPDADDAHREGRADAQVEPGPSA